jgi:hypothetical protein
MSVPASATPYTVAGDEYRNIWLGISLHKPAEYDFVDLDAVYPDNTVLGIVHDETKLKVSLSMAGVDPDAAIQKHLDEVSPAIEKNIVKLDGRPAQVGTSVSKARLVCREREALWIITAEGEDAGRFLNRIIGTWKWISPE